MIETTLIDNIRFSDKIRINGLKDNEVRQDVIDAISDIPFIFNICRMDRKRISDVPKDANGKLIVDITEPHILENMDFFREPAIHFKTHGCYTFYVKNAHPRSRYMQFWKEEQRRCREGLVREDGEWISGYYYWYLNYCPIMKVNETPKVTSDEDVDEDFEVFKMAPANEIEDIMASDRIEGFPSVWDSDYLWFHYVEQAISKGLHCVCIKTRGRGYSFKGGGTLGRNYFHYKKSKSYAIASETNYLIGDAILDKAWDVLNFVDTFTPWVKARDYANRAMHKRASYMDPKMKIERGIRSEIIGVTTKNQPERARGKRGKLLLFEEAGKFPHLLTAYTIARPSVEQGRATFGTIIVWGTGGSSGADFDGLKELFSRPNAHRIYGVPNLFDKNASKKETCGFYCGEYMNREGLTDKDGNSDVVGALIQIMQDRKIISRATEDPNVMVQEKAERSITPEEAMMRREGHLFNVDDLKMQLGEVRTNPKRFSDSTWKVDLIVKEGKVEYRNSSEQVVRVYPIRENKGLKGCIEIFEHPIMDEPPYGLYIAGTDPYDDDTSTGPSLGCTLVMNRLTKRIVAEYTGRPNTAEEFYENTYRLLKYYNATCNYENNKKGMFGYFDRIRALYMLSDTPRILRDMQIVKSTGGGNTLKGTNATKQVNTWGNSLIRSHLVDPAYGREGERNWSTIGSEGMLSELIAFRTDTGNYDRIAAFRMLMILAADMEKYEVNDPNYNENTINKPVIDRFFLKTRSKFSDKFQETNEFKESKRLIRR